MKTWELIVYIEFIVYSIKNELISMFKIDMNIVREEFLKFISKQKNHAIASIMKNPEDLEVDKILAEIDEKIVKLFYIEAKMKNWLKDYKDDYEELIFQGPSSEVSKLKSESKGLDKSMAQKFVENLTRY